MSFDLSSKQISIAVWAVALVLIAILLLASFGVYDQSVRLDEIRELAENCNCSWINDVGLGGENSVWRVVTNGSGVVCPSID